MAPPEVEEVVVVTGAPVEGGSPVGRLVTGVTIKLPVPGTSVGDDAVGPVVTGVSDVVVLEITFDPEPGVVVVTVREMATTTFFVTVVAWDPFGLATNVVVIVVVGVFVVVVAVVTPPEVDEVVVETDFPTIV
jgi:hypothetical protein